jgi:arginase
VANQLRDAGHDVREATIELPHDVSQHEMARTVAIQRELGRAVREAVTADELPVVLAGNCSTAVGTLAARPAGSVVIWFDAHADFNTADTTITGMLDGLALSMVTGRAIQTMTASVQGFIPVDESHVILVGARDLDAAEEAALAASPIARVSADTAASHIADALRAIRAAELAGLPSPRPRRARAHACAREPIRGAGRLVAGIARRDAPADRGRCTGLRRRHYRVRPCLDANGRTLRTAFDALGVLAPRLDGGE